MPQDSHTGRDFEAMFLEDVCDKVIDILAAPLPMVTASRERDQRERIDLALKVLRGEVHPGDVTMPRLDPVPAQLARAFGQ